MGTSGETKKKNTLSQINWKLPHFSSNTKSLYVSLDITY